MQTFRKLPIQLPKMKTNKISSELVMGLSPNNSGKNLLGTSNFDVEVSFSKILPISPHRLILLKSKA